LAKFSKFSWSNSSLEIIFSIINKWKHSIYISTNEHR
jgi:hypothetical protein